MMARVTGCAFIANNYFASSPQQERIVRRRPNADTGWRLLFKQTKPLYLATSR